MSNEPTLFPDHQEWQHLEGKTYSALRHIRVRKRQAENCETAHHPQDKIKQIHRVLPKFFTPDDKPEICEFFAGRGNLTREYERYGTVDAYDQKWLKTGDSYLVFHRLIAERKRYQVIDLDPYGFPSRMLPDVFLLMDAGIFFITMPRPNVNILTAITKTHLECYYGSGNPTIDQILERIRMHALCHWRKAEEIETIEIGRLWRIALRVTKVKATEYTGVRNH